MAESLAENPEISLETKYRELEEKLASTKKHMREWEERSKANAAAAKELEELKKSQMTELQLAQAEALEASERANSAQAELESLRAQNQKIIDAREVSEEFGIPQSLLDQLPDREAMEAQAKNILALIENQPKSNVFKQDGKKPASVPFDPKSSFAEFFAEISR